MADHDPLCIWFPDHDPRSGCIGSIARVRADERDSQDVRSNVTRYQVEAEVRERIAQEIEAKSAEGMAKNWTPAAIRAFDIAARIARGGAQ